MPTPLPSFDGAVVVEEGLSVGDTIPVPYLISASTALKKTVLVVQMFAVFAPGSVTNHLGVAVTGARSGVCFWDDEPDDPYQIAANVQNATQTAAREDRGGFWSITSGQQSKVILFDLPPTAEFVVTNGSGGTVPEAGSVKLVIYKFTDVELSCAPPTGGGIIIQFNGFGHLPPTTNFVLNANAVYTTIAGVTDALRVRGRGFGITAEALAHSCVTPEDCGPCANPPFSYCDSGLLPGEFSFPSGLWQAQSWGDPTVATIESRWFHWDLDSVTGGVSAFSGVDPIDGGTYELTWHPEYTPCHYLVDWSPIIGCETSFRHVGYDEIGDTFTQPATALVLCNNPAYPVCTPFGPVHMEMTIPIDSEGESPVGGAGVTTTPVHMGQRFPL